MERVATAAERFAKFPVPFLTTKDVAAVLGVTSAAIYKRVARLSIPNTFAFQAGTTGRLIFLRSTLKTWAANQGL